MMKSWVRYSVAVYLGLLIAGLTGAPPQVIEADPADLESMPVYLQPAPASRMWHHPGGEIKIEVKTNDRALPSWLKD